MLANVYSHYDETRRVIARIRVVNGTISERVYKRLLKKAIPGAQVYTNYHSEIWVLNKFGDIVEVLH